MKKIYAAPTMEIEVYRLDASIAGNCAVTVTMGDYGGGEGEPVCEDYLELTGGSITFSARSRPSNVNFWENTCQCYTTAGGEGYFTS